MFLNAIQNLSGSQAAHPLQIFFFKFAVARVITLILNFFFWFQAQLFIAHSYQFGRCPPLLLLIYCYRLVLTQFVLFESVLACLHGFCSDDRPVRVLLNFLQ